MDSIDYLLSLTRHKRLRNVNVNMAFIVIFVTFSLAASVKIIKCLPVYQLLLCLCIQLTHLWRFSKESLLESSWQFVRLPRTLNIKVNRHLVAAISVGRDAKIPSAVFAAGANKAENADDAVGRIVLLQAITIVGKLRIQLGACFLPDYLQRMVALRLATQRSVRAQPRGLIAMLLHEMCGNCFKQNRILFIITYADAVSSWKTRLF